MGKKLLGILFSVSMFSAGIWAGGTSDPSTAKWPDKGQQMEMIVGFGAGGTSDTAARFFADALNKKLGIPVVTSNKVGATGSVAGFYLSNAKPNAYTVGFVPIEGMFWKPLGMVPISLVENFTLFGLAVQVPATITIKAKDTRFSDIKSLLEYSKANPGKIKVGTSGVGSNWELAARLIEQKYGLSFTYVPYEGGSNAAVALLQGAVDMINNAPGEFISQIKGGDFKVLGMMTDKRAKFLPEIPTCKEQGYDLVHGGWGVIAGPKNIPADIAAKISEIVVETHKSDLYQNFAMQRYLIVDTPMNGEKATEYARAEWQKLEPLIKAAGWIK